MPLSDEKLVEMAENVATTKQLVESHDKVLETMQGDVSDLRLAWEGEKTARTSMSTTLDELGKKVHRIEKHSNGGLLEQMKPKDLKSMLKWAAIIVAFLVAGSAGGEGLKELVAVLIQMLTVVP